MQNKKYRDVLCVYIERTGRGGGAGAETEMGWAGRGLSDADQAARLLCVISMDKTSTSVHRRHL